MKTSGSYPRITLTFDAIGTSWNIELDTTPKTAERVSKLLTTRIQEFDKTYSRFRPDSWVQNVGNNPGKHVAPKDFKPLYELYQKLYAKTGGAVTVLIGDAMERAGYDNTYSLRPKAMQNIPKVDQVLILEGDTLHVKYPCVIDVGAAGKGYLVDILGQLLTEEGITNFVIDAGGDILHRSPAPSTPVTIGLENPYDSSQAIGVVRLNNQAICGSSITRRAWGDMHHIINANSLTPVRDVVATWVIASSTLVADGLATALFFVDPVVLEADFGFEYVILKADKSVRHSSHLAGELFT